MSRIDYSKHKEYMKFQKFLDDFFTVESTKWNNINVLESDEIISIIHFYEELLSKLDTMYPTSRKDSELSQRKLKRDKYTVKQGKYVFKRSDHKFHHFLVPFHYIVEDRLDFFKNLKKATESWNQKKINNALKHYKIIYNLFLEIKKILSKIEGEGIGWYCNSSHRSYSGSIDFGTLPTNYNTYAGGFSLNNFKKKKFKMIIKIAQSRLEDINQFFQYKQIIKSFSNSYRRESYNQAFDKYIKAEYHKNKINPSNLEHFGILENDKDFKINFAVVVLILTDKIKKSVLDLCTKFTKLEIKEIKEKCNVESTDLIINVIKKMIKDKEIYAEYFSSSNAIAFDQQANSKEIDNLLKKYEQWEKEERDKII